MNSSTSNSDSKPQFLFFTILGTFLCLAIYWLSLSIWGAEVHFAENNINAGLLRLQELDQAEGPAAFTVGTSIIAKLHEQEIFDSYNGTSINMGLDGGSAIFAAERILSSSTKPEIVLVEANLMLKRPNKNSQVLLDETNGLMFKLARYIPLFRREYRPVTQIYNKLKLAKDKKSNKKTSKGMSIEESDSIHVEHPDAAEPLAFLAQEDAQPWPALITSFQKRGTLIIMLMVPDSNNNRDNEYAAARKLAANHHLPFIDLKAELAGDELVYSDGTHLTFGSAKKVSLLLNSVLVREGYLDR